MSYIIHLKHKSQKEYLLFAGGIPKDEMTIIMVHNSWRMSCEKEVLKSTLKSPQ